MRRLRLALAQINPTVGDLRGNALAVRRWLAKAEAFSADLVAFPELTLTGYPPEDLLLKPTFVRDTLATLHRLAEDVGDTACVVGFVDRTRAGLHNAAAVLHRGKVRGVYHKAQLPNYGVFDEQRYFTPGDAYPIFVVRGVQVGVSICEDAWIGDGPIKALARNGAEAVVNINASPYHRGKGLERQILMRQRARDHKVHFAYVQMVGGQDELVFDGESLLFAPDGKLVARGAQFEEDLVFADVELAKPPKRLAARAMVVKLSAAPKRPLRKPAIPDRTRKSMSPIEEVYAALLLGTRDYLRKNGFSSAVIGLSGGIDSALTAVIAADAVGARNVLGVAMPSEITSTESVEDAKELASNLGIEFRILPIAPMVRAFHHELRDVWSDLPPNEAEDNLQARVRGTLLMAVSNKLGHIVLTTGNKSELATGYATLYGDMVGGFAVLKDVPKTLVYQLCEWRNSRGPAPIPQRVIDKPPTAELHAGQLDTDSLPPYEELDPILEDYVERDRSIDEIAAGADDAAIVRRVARLVDLAEYKRRQAAPGVKITPRAFGKDRRLPITNRYREWAVAEERAARAPARARKKKGGNR